MKPLGPTCSIVAAISLLCCSGRADAEAGDAVKTQLALQQAMLKARQHLVDSSPRQAVDVLEANLTRVGGHSSYLALLREAYRAYITQLWLANQPDMARRYLERLCVLEPGAAADPALRPPETKEKRTPEAARPASAPVDPGPKLPKFTAKGPPGKDAVKEPTVRAHAEAPEVGVDPFDPRFRRPDPERDARAKLSQAMVNRADERFNQRRFSEAKLLYEEAYQADTEALAGSKDRYAYCLLDQVVNDLNRPTLTPEHLPTMQKQVEGALALAPTLAETGKWLLREIDLRRKDTRSTASGEAAFSIQHLGRNKEGWSVTETSHFRIFHKQGPELAEKVARGAEATRLAMYRKWFGVDGVEWSPKCELILHETAADYHKMTGVPATSPGHSRIESDPTTKRVVARRMDLRLDHAGTLEAVLPHEATHVVLAGMFDGHAVPRWADEGIAVLSEPDDKREQHRRNLTHSASLGQLFRLRELMELGNYPEPRRISAFYAQSVALVEFLCAMKGPTVLCQFVRDGLRDGYEAALGRHYGLDFSTLEQRWQEHLGRAALATR